jgi:hypothetical protein
VNYRGEKHSKPDVLGHPNKQQNIKLPVLGHTVCLANVPRNCNDTGQRHIPAVCFGEDWKITVFHSKFSLRISP